LDPGGDDEGEGFFHAWSGRKGKGLFSPLPSGSETRRAFSVSPFLFF